jgi:hypothetical protein
MASRMVRAAAPTSSVDLEHDDPMLSSLAQADLTQEAGERVGVTGLAELTRNHAFDDVRDIVRDARDRLIVLDGGANELVIFSAHGESLQR